MAPIMLSDLIKIDDRTQYKLHLACGSEGTRPLNEYAESRDKWVRWNRWRSKRNDWNRDFIFSLIDFHHIPDAWMFGGVFKVTARHDPGPDGANPQGYDLELVKDFDKYEGRLICRSDTTRKRGRGRGFLLESYFDSFEVLQILPTKYDGADFPGYENIDISFAELKPIVSRQKLDWMKRLDKTKGVYLIMDTSTGKYYVGSAYGNDGIWSRLSCYIDTGHGWDQGLIDLINEKEAQGEKDYVIRNFKFSLLEIFTFTTLDKPIIDRETYWKKVLMSQNNFGHFNRN